MLLWRIYVTSKNETYVWLNVTCEMLQGNKKKMPLSMAFFRRGIWLGISE